MSIFAGLMSNFLKNVTPDTHLHIHVRSRHDKPMTVNESIYTDSEFVHHYALTKSGVISAEGKREMFIQIKEWLNC